MNFKLCIFSATTFLSLSVSEAAIADWSASFDEPSSPVSTMRIDLPDDLDVLTLTTLGMELDGIDITALLSLDGADFIYSPVEPLFEGEHLLRLVILNGDGTVTEKQRWTFNIAGSDAQNGSDETTDAQIAAAESWLRSTSFRADTLTEVSNRSVQEDLGNNTPNRTILSGSGDLHADAQGKNWKVQAHTNYLLQSDHSLALTGNTADIAEYDIKADYMGSILKGGVTLGHHDIGLDSHLFSGFYRRGASARVGTVDERMQAQAFAFRPESQSGVRDFTGIHDNEDRLEGVTVSFKPFSDDLDALKVTGVYYDGQGSDGGTGIAGTDTSSTGSGWGLVLAKGFNQQRIQLRAEYAHALFDQDGSASLAQEDSSEAFSLNIVARPFDNIVLMDRAADIVFGARYDRIDTFFESLANPGIAADRNAVQVYSQLYWGALSSSIQFLHETNNVDDLAGAPSDRMRSLSINSSYSFDPQEGNLAWLGAPYLSFAGYVSIIDRDETPIGYTGGDTDNFSDSLTFSAGSSYKELYWSASYSLSEFEDHENNSSDTVNNLISFDTGWASDRLELNGGIQLGAFHDEDNASNTYDTNINIGVSSIIIPNVLDINVDYNLNLATGSGDTPDRHIVNGELEYTIFQPRTNRPGLALAVRGSLEDTNGNANSLQDSTQYQIFTVLRIKAPLSIRH